VKGTAFFSLTTKTNFLGVSADFANSAEFFEFGRESFSQGAMRLYGCTCLILVNQRGVYFTHWWEKTPNIKNYEEKVYEIIKKELTTGTNVHQSLKVVRKSMISTESETKTVKAFLVMAEVNGKLVSEDRVETIKTSVDEILHAHAEVQWQMIKYTPMEPDDLEEPENILRGKALLNYDPKRSKSKIEVFVKSKVYRPTLP
jgi:hypothetical protein